MHFKNSLASITLSATLVSTATAVDLINPEKRNPPQIDDPQPSLFSVCYGNTCHTVEHIVLSVHQWQGVRALFAPTAQNSAQERAQIASAIAYLEVEVGKQIHSLGDRGGNLKGIGSNSNQLDCIDESTNSTSYMRMMQKDGLLKFHTVADRARRGFLIIGGWPHSTAVIEEIESGEKWAVDSWFHDNGSLPDIVTLNAWKNGWRP